MNTVRATGQRDIGARVHEYFAPAGIDDHPAHQIDKRAGGKLFGANLNHLHCVASGARGDIGGVGNAVAFHKIRRSRPGNSTTQSFTPLYFPAIPAGISTAMSPENSRRKRSGFSTVRSSVAGI